MNFRPLPTFPLPLFDVRAEVFEPDASSDEFSWECARDVIKKSKPVQSHSRSALKFSFRMLGTDRWISSLPNFLVLYFKFPLLALLKGGKILQRWPVNYSIRL